LTKICLDAACVIILVPPWLSPRLFLLILVPQLPTGALVYKAVFSLKSIQKLFCAPSGRLLFLVILIPQLASFVFRLDFCQKTKTLNNLKI